MQRQGGVHSLQKPREETEGGSFREGIVEVAFEQWTERAQ